MSEDSTALAVPTDSLPEGWSESILVPAIRQLEPQQLLGLDEELTRQARAREADEDVDEWRRAVAFVRREIGARVEPEKPGPKSLAGAKGLTPALHTKRSEYRLVAEPPDEDFIDWAKKNPTWKALVARSRKWRTEHTPSKPDAELPDSEDGRISLLHGDFRERLTALEPGSVDLILTDPPYPKEDLPLWRDLAQVASKLLAPRGLLIAHTGQIFLPEVLRLVEDGGLTYGWTFALHMPGAGSRIMGRHMIQAWKPVLAFSTGTWPSGEWGDDYLLSRKAEKDKYEWQQSIPPARRLIERFTAPDGLVVDPFLGVGSFGIAAKEAGRRFVGVELDAGRFTKAVEMLR